MEVVFYLVKILMFIYEGKMKLHNLLTYEKKVAIFY